VDDVRRVDAMQNHIHGADDEGEGFLFLAIKRAGLEKAILRQGAIGVGFLQIVERLAVEARRAEGAIVDAFAEFRLYDLNDGTDERAGGVVFAAVAASVAHVLDLGFVEVGQFIFLVLGAETQFVNMVDDFAEVIAALYLVFDLRENLADLVFDGVCTRSPLSETVQVGEEFPIDKVKEVTARHGLVMVQLACLP